MADYAIPKSGVALIFYDGLVSQADTKLLKSAPTLAAGDFKVSIDGGAFANLATLPTNTPGGVSVKFSLSASEMTGDNISIACIDAAGAEWCDRFINIQTSPRGVADLAYPATSGRSMVVDASGLVDANAVKIGPTGAGTAQTARDIGTSVLLSSGTGTGQVKLSAGYIAPNWGDVGNPTTAVGLTNTTVGTLTTYTGNTPQTGDAFAYLGTNMGLLGANLTNLGGMSTTMKAQVETEVNDALVVQRLDELLNADSDIDGVQPPTVGSVFHEALTKTAGSFTYDQTTDSLEAIRDRGDAAWVTGGGGDPWATTLPGAYTETQAGGILGNPRFDRAVNAIVLVTVGVGSTLSSIVTSSLSPAAIDINQFKGRILTFSKDTTTAALRGQSTDVIDSTVGGVFTCTPLTTAPVSGDIATLQ